MRRLRIPEGQASAPGAAVLEKNRPGIEALAFRQGTGDATVVLRTAAGDQSFTAGPGAWTRSAGDALATSGGWTADDTYTLKVVRYRTPFATTYRLGFNGDGVAVEVEQNVGPAAERLTTITGSAARPGTSKF